MARATPAELQAAILPLGLAGANLAALDGPEVHQLGLILLALVHGVRTGDNALLAELALVATSPRKAAQGQPTRPRRRRGLVLATVRGAVARLGGLSGAWADSRAVVSRVLRGRLKTNHAEIVEALVELRERGEIESRELDGRGQVRLTGEGLQTRLGERA